MAVWCLAGVPEHLGLRCGHVDGDGIGSLVGSARGEHVDGSWRYGKGGVVPGKGHPVADLVVLRSGNGVRCDHGETTGG